MNIRMRKQENDVPYNDSPEMESTNEDKKTQSENEHDKDSLNHGDEAIQHHKDSQTEINEDNTNEDIEDIEEQSQSDSKSDASESSKDESGKANKDVHEEKVIKGFINKIPFINNNSDHNTEKDKMNNINL